MRSTSIILALGSIAAGLSVTAASSFQNLQTTDGQLSISSPLVNGIYVAGRVLPFTYIPATNANLQLNLYLRGVDVAFDETTIALNADISNDPSTAISNNLDGTVYYQHSVNYFIPPEVPAGNYQVTYQNAHTNVNTTIPISMLAYVAPSSSAAGVAATDATPAPPSTA